MPTRPFLDEIPTYAISDGIMFITAGEFKLAMPLRKFRLGMARAAKVIAEHDARGVVVSLAKRRRPKH